MDGKHQGLVRRVRLVQQDLGEKQVSAAQAAVFVNVVGPAGTRSGHASQTNGYGMWSCGATLVN